MTSPLLSPLTLRGVTARNRIWVSPMCQYSATDGRPHAWHQVHLGARAVGGAGVVVTEATAVSPEARISPWDTGIWSDELAAAWAPIAAFLAEQGAVPGMQLGHAGRKASTRRPWEGRGPVPAAEGGWTAVAPSALAYADWDVPAELDAAGLRQVRADFADSARRAVGAGFRLVELHAAHGYLLHQFLSPLANQRTDDYGGSRENRMRLLLEVTADVRAALPDDVPLLVRVSATDWVEGGWDVDDTVVLAAELRDLGVDLVDVSSGGLDPRQRIAVGPGYQVPFAGRVRREAGVATGAVGLITDPHQAEQVLADGDADVVLLARALLRDPHWPHRAAEALGAPMAWPEQYERARP